MVNKIFKVIAILVFFSACNANEKVQFTKEERAAIQNEVLNKTPKLLDSLDKLCAKNFVIDRQHYVDSLLVVRQKEIQNKTNSQPLK